MNISPKLLNLIVCFPGFVSWFGSKSAIFTTRGLCIQFDPHWDPLTVLVVGSQDAPGSSLRSEEHTSELQSRGHLVCRLLLEKKNVIERAHPHAGDAERHDGRRTAVRQARHSGARAL